VLEWFKKYGYKIKFSKWIIIVVLHCIHHKNVLKWLKNNNFKIKSYYIKKYKN
jgi:rRNA processing protein Krr1/Pno1